MSDSNLCIRCHDEVESIMHMLRGCENAQPYWNSVIQQSQWAHSNQVACGGSVWNCDGVSSRGFEPSIIWQVCYALGARANSVKCCFMSFSNPVICVVAPLVLFQ